MTKKMQTRPVHENDNKQMETSVEEDELVKTCSGEKVKPPSHAATISTNQASDADSASVAAVVAEKAGGSAEAQPSAAAAVKSRKSKRNKKMKKKVEDEEDREVTFGEDWFEKWFLEGSIASFGMDQESLKKRWASVPMEKKMETEWKWKVLHLEKLRWLLSKHELEYEVASALANATP